MERDALGDRMKNQYEDRVRYFLPRRTFTVVRVDGRGFHNYCKHLRKPYDSALMQDMDETAKLLCAEMMGARFAFVQSDEISVLLTDFERDDSEAWFGGSVQKIASVSAAMATANFNAIRTARQMDEEVYTPDYDIGEPSYFDQMVAILKQNRAQFDARVFTIPDRTEVANYFIWRQQDATRNSIQMAAHHHFSQRECHGKSGPQLQEMLFSEKGVNWDDYPAGCKRGRVVERVVTIQDVTYTDKRSGEERTATGVQRSAWDILAPPIFTQDRDWLASRIPRR